MAKGSRTITGTENDDFIKANGNSDDQIFALGGNDTVSAGAGNDHVEGGDGDDVIDGGAHLDTLDGGAGNDVLSGGAHADTFIFGTGSGVDVITDFKSGEDTVDLTATGISDLTGRVTDNANGDAVIDLGDGNSVTLLNVSSATFLSDPANFVLATGPVTVELGISDTFTDPGGFIDHVITGDVNGEADTDTDTFIFAPESGDDTINDFREADVFVDEDGIPHEIPGDSLDLSAYGIFGDNLTDTGHLGWFGSLVDQGLLTDWFVSGDSDPVQQTIFYFPDGSSLTLLGIGDTDIGGVIEDNIVRDTGGSA